MYHEADFTLFFHECESVSVNSLKPFSEVLNVQLDLKSALSCQNLISK